MTGKLNRPLRRLAKRRHNCVISCGVPSSLQGRPTTSAAGRHSASSAAIAAKRTSFFSFRTAPQVQNRHAARSQYKGCKLFRLAQAARAQRLKRCDQNLLHQVLGGVFVPQVPQAVEPNARRHAAAELGFGFAAASRADLPRQFRVAYLNLHPHTFYV